MKWMTSGANRLKALNRSFGARRNKKSALIKNYESIVVAPFERQAQQTRNNKIVKNRRTTKRHISTNITNAAPPAAEVAVVDKEEDNTTTKRKIIRNGNPQRNRMIGVSSIPKRGVSTFQNNFGVDDAAQRNDMSFDNILMSNQQHDNMPMTHQQQNDSFNTDSIERLVNQQESQSAKKRQHQMQEIVIRERAIQREMKEVALMKQQHMNLNNTQQQQQQPPMMMGLGGGGGGLDFNNHNSYQNTQKSSFNFDLDTMNNTNVGNGGLDILRNDESGASNGLSRFRMQLKSSDIDNDDDDDDEASTSQAIQQEEEPNSDSTMMPMNDSQSAQLKPLPIRYFNNGVEVNMQGSPLSSITSQSNLLSKSAVGGGMQEGVRHHVHCTQQQGTDEEKMPSKNQPPIQQSIGMSQHMMMPQPQLMKQNTNYQMPNNQMTTTGMEDDTPTIQEPLNNEMNQSTLPKQSAKLPHGEDDGMSTKAQRKAKKKAAKKEKRKRSSTTQQSRSSKAQKIDKPKTEEPCHHQEVVKKDEQNKMPSNTVKKTVTTNDAADQMPTKVQLPSLTETGCTSEQSLSAEKKSTNLKADQKMPTSTDDNCNTANQSSSTASSSNVNAEFIPKLSTHISRGPHGDVLDQLFGDL